MDKKEYILVGFDEDDIILFEDTVSELIRDGYTPQGGLAVRVGGLRGATLYQAMVKEGK